MDNAACVSGSQRIRNLRTDSQHLSDGKRPRGMLAFDQFQNQEIGTVKLLQSINRRNMGVVQRSERPCLVAEAGHTFTITSELIWQRLNADIATEFGVVRPVDLPHAALSHGRQDAVMAQLPANK